MHGRHLSATRRAFLRVAPNPPSAVGPERTISLCRSAVRIISDRRDRRRRRGGLDDSGLSRPLTNLRRADHAGSRATNDDALVRGSAMKTTIALCVMLVAALGAQQLPTAPRPGGVASGPAPADAMKKFGVIRGRVLLANARPARRAQVSLATLNGFPRMVKADLDGRYEFTQVQPGDYLVSAGKSGYLVLEF